MGWNILFGYGFSMLFVIPFIHMGKRAFKYFTLIIFGLLYYLSSCHFPVIMVCKQHLANMTQQIMYQRLQDLQ